MKEFKNLLYISQGMPNENDSLDQAIRLSTNNQASLTGLIVCPSLPDNMANYEKIYEQSLLDILNNSIKTSLTLNDENAERPFPIKIASGDKPAIDIIKSVIHHSYDLLIKDAETSRDDSKGFRALDMKLLRKCPCPIWLNRPIGKPRDHQRVSVAIDPMFTTPAQKKLSIKLLQLARSIADSSDSHLHIVSCWDYPLESYLRHHAWLQIEDDELNAQIELVRVNHRAALNLLIAESRIAGQLKVHHLNGKADDEIPRYVADSDTDILVMGTIARTGIPGLIMGNTAENVLQSVQCSLVALKPDDFVSPIT